MECVQIRAQKYLLFVKATFLYPYMQCTHVSRNAFESQSLFAYNKEKKEKSIE